MDLEKRIKSEFDNIKVATYTPLHSQEKPRRQLKKGFIALAAMLVLMTTGVAAAGAVGILGLRQLEDIVGETRAEMLAVVQFTGADGEITSSYTTACGLRINLVATGIHGSVADIYVMLQDMTHSRLDGDFTLNHMMLALSDNPFIDNFSVSWLPFEIIDRNMETGVVTLHTRHAFTAPVENINLYLTLENIYYDVEQVIDIGWQLRIEASGEGQSIALSGLEIPRTDGVVSEIVITPVSVLIAGRIIFDPDGPNVFHCGWHTPRTDYCCMRILLHMHDGTRINIIPERGGGAIPEYGELMYFDAHLVPDGVYILDLDEIAAIEILGEVIRITSAAY